MTNKVLIVEDNPIVAKDIRSAILKLNFKVSDVLHSPENVLHSIKNNEPDIILMDIHLNSKIDGIELITQIHQIKYIPVIYLTGYDDDATILRAIRTKPVGYLLKPFNRKELKSTILLGVYKNDKLDYSYNETYKKIGFDYYYDTSNENLYYKDLHVKLGMKETEFLKLLISANGNIVSFKEIEYELWNNSFISDSTIRTLVYRLRAKLNADLIINEPWLGFRLNILET